MHHALARPQRSLLTGIITGSIRPARCSKSTEIFAGKPPNQQSLIRDVTSLISTGQNNKAIAMPVFLIESGKLRCCTNRMPGSPG
jgi:hypothetical protein